jgi:hypothetical protein
VPPLQIRGPDVNPPPGGNAVLVIYGGPPPDQQAVPNKEAEAPGIDPNAPVLYVVADTAQHLVTMAVLWQTGPTAPAVKLRPPQIGFPPIIYGVPNLAGIQAKRDQAQQQWPGEAPCYLIAQDPGQVIWLQWVWQNGPYPQ